MARPRQPVDLVLANGKKHLTKEEIEERRASEVKPCTDGIVAPAFLTAAQRKEFDKLARQLQKIKIMGETDVDTLARYVSAQTFYVQAVKDLRKLVKNEPSRDELDDEDYYVRLDLWYKAMDTAGRLQDRYFKQAQTAAGALGLTISSRCKLVVPVKDEEPKVNKFAKFGVIEGRSAK